MAYSTDDLINQLIHDQTVFKDELFSHLQNITDLLTYGMALLIVVLTVRFLWWLFAKVLFGGV